MPVEQSLPQGVINMKWNAPLIVRSGREEQALDSAYFNDGCVSKDTLGERLFVGSIIVR